jgi:hypothetical protein
VVVVAQQQQFSVGAALGVVAMTSLNGQKKQSTHGRALLLELRDRRSARIDYILDCLQKDPLSGRLREPDSGNNAYHLLFIGNYPERFTETVLDKLLSICPEGAKAANNHGSLPLHLALTTYKLSISTIQKLIDVHPAGAGVADNDSLVPLFICCMREDATVDICKALCKAFPNGPATKNKTNSFPLHFAAKRTRPKVEIIRVLLRRNPLAASAVNSYGLLPLHCLCALSANATAVELVHSAHPDAIKVPDRQGRTCLHLAVLHTGREHFSAVQMEEQEALLQQPLEGAHDQSTEGGGNNQYSESDSDDHGGGKGQVAPRDELREREGTDRAVIRYLVQAYPQALCTENNFQATPVDTVIEKLRPQRTKNKIISVYGLYDDPFTARLLLIAQHCRSRAYTQGNSHLPNQ